MVAQDAKRPPHWIPQHRILPTQQLPALACRSSSLRTAVPAASGPALARPGAALDHAVVIPLLSTLVIGVIVLIVVGKPITAATTGLTNVLNGPTGTNATCSGCSSA